MTPGTVALQAPVSVELSRQEYWSGLPFPSPRDLPNPGIEPVSPALAGGFFTADPPGEARETCRKLTVIGEKIITGLLLPCDSWSHQLVREFFVVSSAQLLSRVRLFATP